LIAKGTVVVRDGLIEAVGENVTVPTGAWVVDGEGLTVYPGLIDALSTVGYIRGKEISLANKQTRLYEKYMGR